MSSNSDTANLHRSTSEKCEGCMTLNDELLPPKERIAILTKRIAKLRGGGWRFRRAPQNAGDKVGRESTEMRSGRIED